MDGSVQSLMFKSLKTIIERSAAERPVLLAFLIFLSATLVVIPLSIPFYINGGWNFWENIIAEGHGVLFDLLIIGWLFLWLNKIAERRTRNTRYREEIEDYLGWKSPESTHRIAGNIRRLNRGGVRSEFRLTEAFLHGANLAGAELSNSDLWGAELEGSQLRDAKLDGTNLAGAHLDRADLERAHLAGADLRGAALNDADLERADLSSADLRGASLVGADLQYATLVKADLRRAKLGSANLRAADLQGADLGGADLGGVRLRGADLRGTNLIGADLSKADLLGADFTGAALPEGEELILMFAEVRTLFGASFSEDVAEQLREGFPVLFQMSHSGGDGSTTFAPEELESEEDWE